MKIVVVLNSRDVALSGAVPTVVVGADSALLRPGEPVFLADVDNRWMSAIAPAVKIGRLGLHIPRHVALDYVESHSLMHMLLPVPTPADLNLWALSDRSFSPGLWIDGPFDDSKPHSWSIATSPILGNSQVDDLGPEPLDIKGICAPLIAAVSQYSTLKNGDILIFADIRRELPAKPDYRTSASLNDKQVINLKIK